jgi:hypothetical protein
MSSLRTVLTTTDQFAMGGKVLMMDQDLAEKPNVDLGLVVTAHRLSHR